jgi:phage I-like protein
VKLRNGLQLNYKEGEKVKVSPVGKVVGMDGRGFIINGNNLVENININKLDIVLDSNHGFDKALGWFAHNSFEVRDDGIYASLELNPDGVEANTKKQYKYLSPVYEVDFSTREVKSLDSVGFVNRPNLLNEALNNRDGEKMEELQEQLRLEKEKNNRLTQEIVVLKGENQESNEKQLADEVATLKTNMIELNKKLELAFKHGVYERNNQNEGLTDEQKRVAKMLGLTEDEYKGAM